MKKQLIEMLKMQDEMNKIVHNEWRVQHFCWHRAAMIEAAEALKTLTEQHKGSKLDYQKLTDRFIGELGMNQTFNSDVFKSMLEVAEMDFDLLYEMYIGKNTLNRFRQANGYKTGEYLKIWDGKEDNVWLQDILEKSKDIEVSSLSDLVYNQLEIKYNEIK